LFTVRNLNNGNLGEKCVYVYMAGLAGVPCPPSQCSADKKVWEPLIWTSNSQRGPPGISSGPQRVS